MKRTPKAEHPIMAVKHPLLVITLLLLVSWNACAQDQSTSATNDEGDDDYYLQDSYLSAAKTDRDRYNDPYEKWNRGIFAINVDLEEYAVFPIVTGYRTILPRDNLRARVRDFSANLQEPTYMLNGLIRGRLDTTFVALTRFIINSSLGVGGLFDVASRMGIAKRPWTFESNLAAWGGKPGAYMVLPLLGPSDQRALTGLIFDVILDPLNFIVGNGLLRHGLALLVSSDTIINEYRSILKTSLDPYRSIQSIYMQYQASEFNSPLGAKQQI